MKTVIIKLLWQFDSFIHASKIITTNIIGNLLIFIRLNACLYIIVCEIILSISFTTTSFHFYVLFGQYYYKYLHFNEWVCRRHIVVRHTPVQNIYLTTVSITHIMIMRHEVKIVKGWFQIKTRYWLLFGPRIRKIKIWNDEAIINFINRKFKVHFFECVFQLDMNQFVYKLTMVILWRGSILHKKKLIYTSMLNSGIQLNKRKL